MGKAVQCDWFGVSSSVIHERFQRWTKMGLFEKLMKRMVEYYALGSAGASAGGGKRWIPRVPLPLWEARKWATIPPTGQGWCEDEPPARGARRSTFGGAKRSQSPRDKISATDLIVSVALKRPAHKEQHLCVPTKPTMLPK
jgi:hypothetical protein